MEHYTDLTPEQKASMLIYQLEELGLSVKLEIDAAYKDGNPPQEALRFIEELRPLREHAITYLARRRVAPYSDSVSDVYNELLRIREHAAIAQYQRKHNLAPEREPQREKWFADIYPRYWELRDRLGL